MPKDRRDFEKPSGEGRDKYPVKQVDIELKVIFQNAKAQNDKTRAMTKAESLALWLHVDSSGEDQSQNPSLPVAFTARLDWREFSRRIADRI
ncbi:MAG: hypothetical protein DME36_07710 [Verrucomicrobia bacterium]|nr:MAG: hypothetical protein DME36_07710 [Verrucomicrobiota bacterium]